MIRGSGEVLTGTGTEGRVSIYPFFRTFEGMITVRVSHSYTYPVKGTLYSITEYRVLMAMGKVFRLKTWKLPCFCVSVNMHTLMTVNQRVGSFSKALQPMLDDLTSRNIGDQVLQPLL